MTETREVKIEELKLSETFGSLREMAENIQKLCDDDIITLGDLQVTDNLKFNGKDMTTYARGELCGKLGIPSRYISKCIERQRETLAADNLRSWIANDTRKVMLRNYDGHIRGVMSGAYSRYDAPDILKSVEEVFGNKNFKIKGSYLDEERMHLRLVETEQLPINEDLYAGIAIDSSDIGRSALSARFFIYKKVCTNGLMIAQSKAKIFTQKHIGITPEEFRAGLEDGLKNFEPLKESVVKMIEATHEIPLPSDIEEAANEIKDRTKLSDDAVEEILSLAINKYERTRWGLINGLTEVAQKYTLERRLALEEIAGNMLA